MVPISLAQPTTDTPHDPGPLLALQSAFSSHHTNQQAPSMDSEVLKPTEPSACLVSREVTLQDEQLLLQMR